MDFKIVARTYDENEVKNIHFSFNVLDKSVLAEAPNGFSALVDKDEKGVRHVEIKKDEADISREYAILSGNAGGVCYMPHKFEDLLAQSEEKKIARAESSKALGHHSIFDHEYITMYLEDVPKMFAILLNNEKVYATSEKSARYTKMAMAGQELDLYNKWLDIFVTLITDKYGKEKYFDEKRIRKLAQENARYFLSVYTPTSLLYTCSYRQLNYIYGWLKDLGENELLGKLQPTANEFRRFLEQSNLVDNTLANYSNRGFSLIAKKVRHEYFGDVYCTNYLASFAEYAQAERHRSINYEMRQLKQKEYYVPKLIEKDVILKQSWLDDMAKVAGVTPQGELVQVNERGIPENLIQKARERLCTCAQLEIANQTQETIRKYIAETIDFEIINQLKPYADGARCTAGYDCHGRCEFADGVKMEREV